MKQIIKQLNKIKEVWGVEAFEEIMEFCFKLYQKIEDLTKSRNNWKQKYMDLKSASNSLQVKEVHPVHKE